MKTRTACLVLAIAFSVPVRAEDGPQRVRPKTYGTSPDSIYHVPITDFVPFDSGSGTRDWFFSLAFARYTPGCTGPCLYAIPRLPDGALLTGIEAYFCNTNPDHNNYPLGVQLYSSLYDGTNNSYLGAAVYSSSSNGCGEFQIADLTSLNYQVNYYNNQLVLVGRIDRSDGSQALAGVNLFYRLQVSPAPPTSDFGDVPTSSPQYQFIERCTRPGSRPGAAAGTTARTARSRAARWPCFSRRRWGCNGREGRNGGIHEDDSRRDRACPRARRRPVHRGRAADSSSRRRSSEPATMRPIRSPRSTSRPSIRRLITCMSWMRTTSRCPRRRRTARFTPLQTSPLGRCSKR